MRTYIAQELIGTIWLLIAIFSGTEKLPILVTFIFLLISAFYFMRAVINYSRKKVKEEDERGKT